MLSSTVDLAVLQNAHPIFILKLLLKNDAIKWCEFIAGGINTQKNNDTKQIK